MNMKRQKTIFFERSKDTPKPNLTPFKEDVNIGMSLVYLDQPRAQNLADPISP